MKKTMNFIYNFFLAIGIVWFFCAVTLLFTKIEFQQREILLTLIFPLAYAIVRLFDKEKQPE